jgi:Card1-like endonuclease family protein
VNRPETHLCIATGQNLANLIPALQLAAQEVVILETPEMRETAGNLKRALEAHGIRVTRLGFDDRTPETIARSAERVAVELGERPLIFNATGGHKLMTLALAEHMKLADDLHLLYAETRHDRLDWLKPRAEVEPMADVLTLEDVLLVQGYRLVARGDRDVKWRQQAAERESLTRRLGDQAERLSGLFGALNFLADAALANEPQGPFRPRQALQYPPKDGKVLRDAERLGLLSWDGANEVVFASEQAARYFRGGWLEEYALIKLVGIKPRDWGVDVQIESARGKTTNQFDALVVHRNRLLVIECKTSRFGRDAAKDADYIYKLAQLSRNVGGIMSRSLLLSARPVTDEVRRRAGENEVDILAAAEVTGLVDYLRQWMGR